MPRDNLVIADPRPAKRFLLHCIARCCRDAGVVVPGALVFERVADVGVFIHRGEVGERGILRRDGGLASPDRCNDTLRMANQAKIRPSTQGAFVALTPDQLKHLKAKIGDTIDFEIEGAVLTLKKLPTGRSS